MAASVANYLGILLLGGIMGIIGQGARTIIGLKKMFDQAETLQVGEYDLFAASRLFVSLFIGFVAGAAAAVFTATIDASGNVVITPQILTALAMAGYAGADFIEGISSRFTSGSAAMASARTTELQETTQQLKLVTASLSTALPSTTSAPGKPKTVGDALTLLSDAYIEFSQAVDDAKEPLASQLASARDLVGWLADEITEQRLRSDAKLLFKLTEKLKDPTGKLKELKKTLQQLQTAAGVAGDVLNLVAKLLPIL